jgi:hypothetical protein
MQDDSAFGDDRVMTAQRIVTLSEAKSPRAKRKRDGSQGASKEFVEGWDPAAKLPSASRGDSSTSSE